jgi:DNA-binding beta-propeller fold protein YncE
MDFDNFASNLKELGKLSAIATGIIMLCFTTLPYADMSSSGIQTDSSGVHVTEPWMHFPFIPEFNYLLVIVNHNDNSLELIDPISGKMESYMNLNNGPISVMPQPGTMNAAVLTENPQQIKLVNMSTAEIYADISLTPSSKNGIGTISNEGCVDHIFWRHDRKYLYVVTDTFLAVINVKTYAVEKCFDQVGSRVAADMNSQGTAMLLFRKVKDNTYIVDRLNTSSNLIEKSATLSLDFDATNVGPLRFSPDGTEAYTFIDDMGMTGWTGIEPNLIIINNSTLNVNIIEDALPTVHSVSSTNRMDLEISPDGKHLYMLYSACERTKLTWARILVYDITNHTFENTFYSAGREIGGIALSPDGSLLYATNYCNYFTHGNTISVLNAHTGEVLRSLDVYDGPIDVKTVKYEKYPFEVAV